MDFALVVASVALVVVTTVYTWHTRAMVAEMKATRALSVTPRLGLPLHEAGPTYAELRLINIGHGPALNVDLNLLIAAVNDERRRRAPLLAPGGRPISSCVPQMGALVWISRPLNTWVSSPSPKAG